jgi:membrane-bound lytic murein transglycosylase D
MGFAFAVHLAGALVTLSLASTAVAQTDTTAFPRPAALEPAVRFWTRVYTEVDTDAGFIHDDWRLDIVYQTIDVSRDLSPRERRRRIERSITTHRSILTKLGGGARSNLSNDEQRVLALFPQGTSNAEFRSAADRVRFQLGQADRFRAGLIRSGTWKPYIYEVLARRGLPRELAALPHVESSFDPTAYSKVGAAGMWQFTRSTGVRYMRIDQVIDERRDPFFATDAAARLLADNYSVLQSWPLALTAYNHGLAGMRRATLQQKTTDIDVIVAKYQSRSFGFASRNFYTAFLAALQIDSNPEAYFGNMTLNPPSPTAVVIVPDYLKAETLAHALNLREGVLQDLNPALMETVWAGDKLVPKGFELRVPTSTAAVAEDLLASIAPAERYAAQRPDLQHRVRRGDTLSAIAAQYRVSLATLMRINGLTGRSVLRVGQMISLPGGVGAASAGQVVLAAATTPPSAPTPPEPVVPEPAAGEQGIYTVRSGDSVARIATRFGVGVDELLAANDIGNRNLIYAGQTLQIPRAEGAAPPAEAVVAMIPSPPLPAAIEEVPVAEEVAVASAEVAVEELSEAEELLVVTEPGALGAEATGEIEVTGLEAATEVNALSTAQAALAADPSDYSVSAGDVIQVQALETLGHYADWLELPTQRLRVLNKLSFREAVVIGQKLTLDFSRVAEPVFEQRRIAYQQAQQGAFFARYQIEDTEEHVIKSGESLWLLAERTYKVPVWLLRQYNPDLDLDRVQTGTVVKFPRLRALPDAQPADTSSSPTVADRAL